MDTSNDLEKWKSHPKCQSQLLWAKSVGQLKFKVQTSLSHLIMKEPVCIVSRMVVVFDDK